MKGVVNFEDSTLELRQIFNIYVLVCSLNQVRACVHIYFVFKHFPNIIMQIIYIQYLFIYNITACVCDAH